MTRNSEVGTALGRRAINVRPNAELLEHRLDCFQESNIFIGYIPVMLLFMPVSFRVNEAVQDTHYNFAWVSKQGTPIVTLFDLPQHKAAMLILNPNLIARENIFSTCVRQGGSLHNALERIEVRLPTYKHFEIESKPFSELPILTLELDDIVLLWIATNGAILPPFMSIVLANTSYAISENNTKNIAEGVHEYNVS